MAINKAALDLIKEFEGFVAHAYRDAVGVWTIGYGTTAMAGVGIDPKPGMSRVASESRKQAARRPRPPLPRPASIS